MKRLIRYKITCLAGYVHTEGSKSSMQRMVAPPSDVAQCVALARAHRGVRGPTLALADLTLGIPPAQVPRRCWTWHLPSLYYS